MNPIQDEFLLDCPTYEDYLDTYITKNDLRYLQSIHYSRMLVELGYRSTTDIYTPEQYEQRKAAAHEAMFPIKRSLILFHKGIKITDLVLLELARRESLNYQKIISTIIFLRQRRKKSDFEISGFIDYEHSLRKSNLKSEASTDWRAVFQGKKVLRPKPTDLSFTDTKTKQSVTNDSDNYVVIKDDDLRIIFMHKGDRKKIYVTGVAASKMNATKTILYSPVYGNVILYDHIVRKKA